ncbi:hypothetical protein CC80DRAFT_267393 [Byssothecium circinans]|uniref:Uncharacterized protein n=1 Tax=Byssothecium circinans TaxID=147558 RepID=A0A6A5UAR2_9PLEO|nr:hypothetical protein CC80DRAFT_267393 [Byssothecium circinans]
MGDEQPGKYFFLCFMSLPAELREMVYSAKFEGLPEEIIVSTHMPNTLAIARFAKLLPAICYTNRTIFNESVPVLFRERTITLSRNGVTVLGDLLKSIPNQHGFRAITSLEFGSGTMRQYKTPLPKVKG